MDCSNCSIVRRPASVEETVSIHTANAGSLAAGKLDPNAAQLQAPVQWRAVSIAIHINRKFLIGKTYQWRLVPAVRLLGVPVPSVGRENVLLCMQTTLRSRTEEPDREKPDQRTGLVLRQNVWPESGLFGFGIHELSPASLPAA